MDTTLLVALTGVASTVITTGGIIAVALIKREDEDENGTAIVLRERLNFKNEVIEALKSEIDHKEKIIGRLKDRINELEIEIVRLKSQLTERRKAKRAGYDQR